MEFPKRGKGETVKTPEQNREQLRRDFVWGLETYVEHVTRTADEKIVVREMLKALEDGKKLSLSQVLAQFPDFFERVIPSRLRNETTAAQLKADWFTQ